MDLAEVGRRIKEARQKCGLTQTQLGQLLGYSAANPVSKLESGHVSTIDAFLLKRIGQVTNTWMPYLLGDVDLVKPYGAELPDERHGNSVLMKELQSLRDHLDILVAPSTRLVPLLGRVPAGALQEALSHADEHVALPAWWENASGVFLLRVAGHSMRPTLLDGDLVVVYVTPTADEGDIVVVAAGDETTVKRLKRVQASLWLMPDNPEYDPMPVGDDTHINGRVVGLLRDFERRRRTE